MAYTDEQLSAIFERTDGHCHVCGRRVVFKNYGRLGLTGAWEVEHSRARSLGGCDRLCNLFAAHITCNRAKGARSSRAARAAHGRTRAPLSADRKEAIRSDNLWGWGSIGALAGTKMFGPPGLILGAILGALVGAEIKPE